MAAQDYEQVTYNSADGAQMGASATEKVGFWGATPVVQRSGSSQAALTLVTTSQGGYGFVSTTGFSAFIAQLEEIRAALVQYGFLKGSS